MTYTRSYAIPSQDTGSPNSGEPEFLAVGKLRRPHGVHGEILMEVLTDFPERLKPAVKLYIGDEHRPLSLAKCRTSGNGMLVSFDGYDTPEKAGELRNLLVYVLAADRPPLPEGEYYQHQLIGLRVVTEDEEILGTLTEILETGANNVYVVRPPTGPEVLLPAIESVVREVNLERKEMRVHLLPGLRLEA
jgi:16S rRNA processing protein RimM